MTVTVAIPSGCLTVSYLLCCYCYKLRLGVMYYVRYYYLYLIFEVCMLVTMLDTSEPMVGMAVVDVCRHVAEVASNFPRSDDTCEKCKFVVCAPPIMCV